LVHSDPTTEMTSYSSLQNRQASVTLRTSEKRDVRALRLTSEGISLDSLSEAGTHYFMRPIRGMNWSMGRATTAKKPLPPAAKDWRAVSKSSPETASR